MIDVQYKYARSVQVDSHLYQILNDAFERLLLKDPTIWGSEASAEAKIRMGCIDNFKLLVYSGIDSTDKKRRNTMNF